MNVIFVEPDHPAGQRQYVRALAEVGARVTGVGERPYGALDDELKGWLAAYEQVASVTDEGDLEAAVRRVQDREWVDRLEATLAGQILPVAKVREACTIPGTSVHTAYLCRDKTAMKEALQAAGVPCARFARVASPAEARAFAGRVGYPVIVKALDPAGAGGTFRAGSGPQLEHALRALGVDGGAVAGIEEFVEGHEGFYDTLALDGRVCYEFVSHYYPNVLEAMRTRWISPQVVATNRTEAPGYAELRALGRRVIEVLGVETSATHMHWFFGPKGLKFSDVACRPPAFRHWDTYCAANDFDLYREWALAVAHGRTERAPSRAYSCGIIALRPDRDGVIAGYEGTREIWRRYGAHIVADCFPEPGTATRPIASGYLANAWMRVRHADYDQLRSILDEIGRTVRVHAG